MPDITETEVRQFIATKLNGVPPIDADAHREVENKIMDFVVQENAKNTKTKVLMLESFSCDRNYSVSTSLPLSAVIDSVQVMLVCKADNNGFVIGDTVTAPTPYFRSGQITTDNGIGVQFNNINNSVIRIMVNDRLVVMTAYNPASGALANCINIIGVDAAKWSIKLIISYK